MAETNSNDIVEKILSFLQNNIVRQAAFLAGVAGSVALGLYFYAQLRDPMYKPLDYRVTDKNAAMIADTLDKANITYKINESDGVVMVADKDMQLAKIKLGSAGIQKDDSLNFSYLNDQNSIGESQFLENARYSRALENDLAKTITSIDGISSARVHIAMPQNATFADENEKPTASVFITLAPGLTSDKEKIRSIIRIVASSVPGLDPQEVAITDQYGHYLSDSMSKASVENAEQMAYQNDVQNYYEKRIQSLIMPMVGENKLSVKVNADIDFSQEEEASEQYDPNNKVIRSEQTDSEEVGSSSSGGPAGALANTPPDGGSDSGSSKASNSSSQGRTQTIKNYEISKSVKYKRSNVAKVNAISVAVVVDNDVVVDPKTKKTTSKPLDKEKLDKIKELIKATIGYDEKRGDIVTVVNSNFTPMDIPEVKQDPMWQQAWFWSYIREGGSLLFAAVMFLMIYRKSKEYYARIKIVPTTTAASKAPAPGEVTPEMQDLKQEQINRLKEIASRDPNRVALVIKNWVGEK